MTFFDIAKPMAEMGVPQIRVRADSKVAFDKDWPSLATTDLVRLAALSKEYPNSNSASVAQAKIGGIWIWEIDSPDVIPRMEQETGQNLPPTFRVRSRPRRGHIYFQHTPASIEMGNLSQTYVVGQDWSVRANNMYAVSAGSIHPSTGKPYEALNWGTPISEAPDWLVAWLISQKIQKKEILTADTSPRDECGKVPHGSIHGFLLHHAGRLRNVGLTQEEIEKTLVRITTEQCAPPIDFSKVRQMAKSICNFPPGEDKSIALTQTTFTGSMALFSAEPEEELIFEEMEYPVFPNHVMFGTSLYEGFAKPYCEVNSRVPYFMWAPAAAMMMNYLGTKVNVPFKSWKSSFYIVLIGEKGRANKSSSIKDGMKFLEFASVLSHYSKEIKNADGKSLVWEAGSPEGLGTDMQRTNCKNAVLFYDELSALVSKARIEGSGMNSTLLKMYESSNFANSIKSKKDTFAIQPGTYCATLITATTDKKFTELWSQLAGQDTGLDDRFTFILQPKELPKFKLENSVNYNEDALKTRKLIDFAVNKKTYEIFDQTPLQRILEIYGNRAEIRAEKWALYFAIDLGLEEIDEDCVARGIELVKYEQNVKKYLMQFEAKNDEAAIQQGVMRLLKRNKGELTTREIEKMLNSNRYGLSIWRKAFYALANAGYIVEEGRGCKGDPRKVRMLRDMSFGDDE